MSPIGLPIPLFLTTSRERDSSVSLKTDLPGGRAKIWCIGFILPLRGVKRTQSHILGVIVIHNIISPELYTLG